jgi:hypothetical protein
MKPNLERLDRLIAAAQAWREFQYRDSLLDQKTDVRVRHAAEDAYGELLAEIDHLEDEPPDSADDDPTPWCNQCGARKQAQCKCGPIAENE